MFVASLDPIHYGHINTIERASLAFNELTVALAVNETKTTLFTMDERVEMARKSLSHLQNVKVDSFSGMTSDYAFRNNIRYHVRGVRSSADLEFEKTLHDNLRAQNPNLETFILFSDPTLSHMSSSAVKTIQGNQGDIHAYVPLHVKQAVEQRLSGQFILGVTGVPGSGKSYVSSKLAVYSKSQTESHHIDLDKLAHKMYTEENYLSQIRPLLIKEFGSETINSDGTVNRKYLGDKAFESQITLMSLNSIVHPFLIQRFREEIKGKKGLILLDAAILSENNLEYLTNNNFVLVTADDQTQYKRLQERNWTNGQIAKRKATQLKTENKRNKIQLAISKAQHGIIIEYDTSSDAGSIKELYESVSRYFNGFKK